MSSSSQDPPPSENANTPGEVSRLKCQLAAAQEELKELSDGKVKKPPYVSDMFDPLHHD